HTRSKRDWSSDVCSSDLGSFAVLVLLRRERSVLGEIHRDPTRISRLQPLVPVNAGSGQTVTTAFLQVGVTDDVGPHLRQPRPELDRKSVVKGKRGGRVGG